MMNNNNIIEKLTFLLNDTEEIEKIDDRRLLELKYDLDYLENIFNYIRLTIKEETNRRDDDWIN